MTPFRFLGVRVRSANSAQLIKAALAQVGGREQVVITTETVGAHFTTAANNGRPPEQPIERQAIRQSSLTKRTEAEQAFARARTFPRHSAGTKANAELAGLEFS